MCMTSCESSRPNGPVFSRLIPQDRWESSASSRGTVFDQPHRLGRGNAINHHTGISPEELPVNHPSIKMSQQV